MRGAGTIRGFSVWLHYGFTVAYLWLGLTVEIVTYKMVSREGI